MLCMNVRGDNLRMTHKKSTQQLAFQENFGI